MLEFRQLTKAYRRSGNAAVSEVSFDVHNGEVMGFVGLNGAGKTTTIRVAAGILVPTAGTVQVDGHDIVTEKIDASAQIGVVPESPLYEPQARALPCLKYLAAYHGIDGPTAERRGRELLSNVGLAGQEQGRLRTYSLGMRKRFAIAAALISDPQNLLLDEVLNGLDPAGLAFTRSFLNEMRRSGRSVLLSSHNLAEVQEIADRVAFIHAGRLLRVATREEIARFGTRSVIILFEPVDDRALLLLARFGTPERLRPNAVALRNLTAEPSAIVAALVGEQYRVAEVRPEEPALEGYFLKLVTGAS